MTFAGKTIAALRGCLLLAIVLMTAGTSFAQQRTVRMALADGFDFPVGKPNAAGYYTARGVRLTSPVHYGEDWNGRSGGDSDMGDPVYATGDGIVVWAYDVQVGWGNVVIIRHAYRDPATGQVKFCDSLYGHLREFSVKVGQTVKRGQQIGTIGNNRGMYAAHLHFEIRHNLNTGMLRDNVPRDFNNWAVPSDFINKYRRLNREWGAVAAPVGNLPDYQGFQGL